jgi:hypothetical protein
VRSFHQSGLRCGPAAPPALADLAEEYDLAVSKVQKAMQALKDAGLVVTSAMGTFAAE